jgi:hypothetical protein
METENRYQPYGLNKQWYIKDILTQNILGTMSFRNKGINYPFKSKKEVIEYINNNLNK